jgi:hypothetical protein
MDLITSDLNSHIYICTGVEAVTGLPLGIAWVIPQPARPARIEKKSELFALPYLYSPVCLLCPAPSRRRRAQSRTGESAGMATFCI